MEKQIVLMLQHEGCAEYRFDSVDALCAFLRNFDYQNHGSKTHAVTYSIALDNKPFAAGMMGDGVRTGPTTNIMYMDYTGAGGMKCKKIVNKHIYRSDNTVIIDPRAPRQIWPRVAENKSVFARLYREMQKTR